VKKLIEVLHRSIRREVFIAIAGVTGMGIVAACFPKALTQRLEGENSAAPSVSLSSAPLVLMHGVDSNSPAYWNGKVFFLINSADGHQFLSSGPDIAQLGYRDQIHLGDTDDRLYIWIEAAWKSNDGTLYGAYHYEPDALCKSNNHLPTAPKIAWIRSRDNGATWDDLGFIISANPSSIRCDSASPWDVGGTGDFSLVSDRSGQYVYFYGTSYDPDFEEQGVFAARMKVSDRDNPSGKVWKWYKDGWTEPGEWGRVTPIFRPEKDFTHPGGAMFWGPSIHWNTYLGMYVMLLNHAIDPDLNTDGIYISFNRHIDDPTGWSRPKMILDRAEIQKVMQGVNLSPTKMTNGWYPEVIGDGPGETDSLVGKTGRLFLAGVSRLRITFVKPGDETPATIEK
jgi:hypothetical protein